jgi:hypothetical protein
MTWPTSSSVRPGSAERDAARRSPKLTSDSHRKQTSAAPERQERGNAPLQSTFVVRARGSTLCIEACVGPIEARTARICVLCVPRERWTQGWPGTFQCGGAGLPVSTTSTSLRSVGTYSLFRLSCWNTLVLR